MRFHYVNVDPRKDVSLGIQKCKSCSHTFTWKEVQKAIQWTFKPLVCKMCKTEHRVTKKTRTVFAIPFHVISGGIVVSTLPILIKIALLLMITILAILIFPYIASYEMNID
ncbi:TIGR04104 family putative zinc finger protein [Halobacillus faecis]|uniref:TIGR04104 family putative zinc finger protein n=1 Tax=Halobacillus faecis TaxID=360184 RepID=UPI0035305BA1